MGEAYEPRSGCPINATIEVFGDRWSLLVLRDIVFGDRRYFRELQAGEHKDLALGWESGIGTTGQYSGQDLIPGNIDDGFHLRDDEAVLASAR